MDGDDKEELDGRNNDAYSGNNNNTQQITEQLKQCAAKANNSIQGKGPAVGSQKHTAFKNLVKALNIKNLKVEASHIGKS